MNPIRSFAIATAAVAALGLAGCYGSTGVGYSSTYPSGYSALSLTYASPPYGIEYYPRYPYNGSYAYLVGDTWWLRYGTGWGYLPYEPYPLYNYRVQRYHSYGYRAPPAYRPAPYVAPPAYRPGPYAAPPAYRPAPYAAPPAYRPPTVAPPPVYRPPTVAPPPAYRPPSAPPPTFHAPPRMSPAPTPHISPPVIRAPPAPHR